MNDTAGCELHFALPLAAATGPGPGSEEAGWADRLDEIEEQLLARFCTNSAQAPLSSSMVFSPHRGSEFFILGAPGGSGIGGAPAAATERLCYRAAAAYMFV